MECRRNFTVGERPPSELQIDRNPFPRVLL